MTRNRTTPAPADTAVVQRHFFALCKHFNRAATDVDVQAEWVAVQKAYGAPERHYHNLAHIAHMLRAFEKLDLPEDVLMEMRAAAIYHDIVYVTQNQQLYRQNEYLSSARGVAFLGSIHAPDAFLDAFKARVEATRTHEIDQKADYYGALFLDLDMSILGAKPAIYRDYVAAIRKEFAGIPDEVFYPARLKFLRDTLQKDRIFKTDLMHERLDRAARKNIRDEIQRIQAMTLRKSPVAAAS
jgi:predicted metal-dependent HD superfamily phosphohydrolase